MRWRVAGFLAVEALLADLVVLALAAGLAALVVPVLVVLALAAGLAALVVPVLAALALAAGLAAGLAALLLGAAATTTGSAPGT